ncbi:hypothetical protein [uncultured Muribaculum sp.]|uniref:hypothetical protein n=1 Tax=uncultured Muribaculum sp. TaxID=1918613 RepID=UPI0027315AE0|nr:hypothetical protein [uncultured Muribaculum sp.]
MAIDIKSLRIGSHIDFNGRRVKIKAIVEDSVAFDYTQDEKQLYLSPNAYDEFLSPIPITSELLKELGFEDDKTDIVKRVGGYFVYFHQINNLRWRVSLEEENCTNYGNTLCRYLHEAEAFLALHGVELIQD